MGNLLVALLLAASSPEVEARAARGDVTAGALVGISDRQVTLQTAAGRVTLAIDQLAGLALKNPASPGGKPSVWLELVDGSALVGSAYTAADARAQLTLLSGRTIELPIADIRCVRLEPQSEAIAAEWSRILARELLSDLLVIHKSDSIDYHKGVLGDVTGDSVGFKLAGGPATVSRGKVHGLVYYHAGNRLLPASDCTVVDAAGSRWSARSLALAGETLSWTTPSGIPVSRPLAELAEVNFKIAYLSDFRPESVEWTPYFGTGKELPSRTALYAPREDRSLESGPLQLEGKTYRKGVTAHSRTRLVYRLPAEFSRFFATVGIDDHVRPLGNVRLVIEGDGRVLWEGTVAGTDPAKPLELDIKGVRRLAILVDFGKDLDIGDHLDLCEARLIK
jgi:hypothetical protein